MCLLRVFTIKSIRTSTSTSISHRERGRTDEDKENNAPVGPEQPREGRHPCVGDGVAWRPGEGQWRNKNSQTPFGGIRGLRIVQIWNLRWDLSS